MTQLYLAYLAIGLMTLGIGLLSNPLKQSILAPPLISLVAGDAIGPIGLGWLRPDTWADPLRFLEEVARP